MNNEMDLTHWIKKTKVLNPLFYFLKYISKLQLKVNNKYNILIYTYKKNFYIMM